MPKRPGNNNWMGEATNIPAMLRHYADLMASGDEVMPARLMLITFDHHDNPQIRTLGYGEQGAREVVGSLNEGVRCLSDAIASTNTYTGN